jgi:hypothetical protein
MDLQKLKPENSKALVILIGGVVLVVLLAVYINKTFGGLGKFFGSISDALGITDSPETQQLKATIQAAKNTSASPASPWSPQYYKDTPAGARLMTQAGADALASQIWDSVNWLTGWHMDEVVGAIKQLSAKSQVSFLADRFQLVYNADLLTWITMQYTSTLGGPDPGIGTIVNYVNSLPAI